MTELSIVEAKMHKQEDGSYIGKTVFQVESHKVGYEITFYSKKGHDWDYSLNYAGESGVEEQFIALDARLEEDDEWFDALLNAALGTLPEE